MPNTSSNEHEQSVARAQEFSRSFAEIYSAGASSSDMPSATTSPSDDTGSASPRRAETAPEPAPAYEPARYSPTPGAGVRLPARRRAASEPHTSASTSLRPLGRAVEQTPQYSDHQARSSPTTTRPERELEPLAPNRSTERSVGVGAVVPAQRRSPEEYLASKPSPAPRRPATHGIAAARLQSFPTRHLPDQPALRSVEEPARATQTPLAPTADARTAARATKPLPRQDIQFLRALAVTLVLLAHAGVSAVEGGFVGVDVFFVISGYLITAGLLRQATQGTVDLPAFMARRLRRLMPPALLVIVVTLVGVWAFAPSLDQERLSRDGAWSALWVVNYIFAERGLDYHATVSLSPFMHFWSLAIEEQFYVIWPAVIAVVALTRRRVRTSVGLVAASIVVASFMASEYLTVASAPTAYFTLQSRAWELAVGAVLAAVYPALRETSTLPAIVHRGAALVGLGLIVGSALTLTTASAFPGTAAVPAVAGTALMLWAGRGGSTLPGMSLRPVQSLGNISYGVYLWHWPLLVSVPWIVGRELHTAERAACVGVAIMLAAAMWRLLEVKVQEIPAAARTWIPTGATAVAATAAIALGLATWQPGQTRAPLAAPTAASDAEVFADQLRKGHIPDSVITAVETPAPLSSSLTPPVADVQSSAWQEVLGDCHQDFEGSRAVKGCFFGDVNAQRTAVLVGDSHAAHWAAAVDSIGEKNGWRVAIWTKSACPMMQVEFYSPRLKRTYSECAEWQANVRKRVAAVNPEVLLFSHSATTDQMLPEGVTWTDAVTSEAEVLRGMADQVWHIEDTPHAMFDVPQCVADHSDDVSACAVKLNDHPAYKEYWRQEARVYAAHGFDVLRTRDLLVHEGKMPVVINDRLVLLDEHHLSNDFARHFAPIFEQALPATNLPAVTRPTSA